MKRLSVKVKITLLLTLLTALLSGLLLLFLLSVSSQVDRQASLTLLRRVAQDNIARVHMEEGVLSLDEDFLFLEQGVSTLVYSNAKALLAGQVPVSFRGAAPAFANGEIRSVALAGGPEFFVLDVYLPFGWENGVWLRALLEAPRQRAATGGLLRVAFVLLPLFISLAGLGSYLIVKRAFRPLEHINATACAINEARDLRGRIGLPPGGDEFSRLAENFDGMFARLEASFEAEKQFAADASHELRTPLSVISSACEYAEAFNETPEEWRESVEMIHRQAGRMRSLVTQLLQMTRLAQGTELAQFAQAELGALVRAHIREGAYDEARLRLSLEEDVRAEVDATLFARLLENLLTNAFKFSPPETPVYLRLWKEGDEVRLSVRDEGPGIPPEAQEKVWQRFYQLDAARSGAKGAGLGLSMVRQIALLHGGRMELRSEAGKGACFTLCLPCPKEV